MIAASVRGYAVVFWLAGPTSTYRDSSDTSSGVCRFSPFQAHFHFVNVYDFNPHKSSPADQVIVGFITGGHMRGKGFDVLAALSVRIHGAIIGGCVTRALAVTNEGRSLHAIVVAVIGAIF